MKKGIYLIVGFFLAVLLGAFFILRKPQNNQQNKVSSTPTPPTSGQETSPAGIKEVQVIGSEYSYSPSSIRLDKGTAVKLTFRNTGRLPHNLVIDELGVATQTIQSGASDTVEFTASQSGTFSFYCSIGNHRSLGMEGSLEVK